MVRMLRARLLCLAIPTILAAQQPAGSPIDFEDLIDAVPAASSLAVALDGSGAIYQVGCTEDPNFPTTTGALRSSSPGTGQLFARKFSPDGSTLVYSATPGIQCTPGVQSAFPSAVFSTPIAADSAGDLYVFSGAALSKISPKADKIIYSATVPFLAVTNSSLALNADGSVYVSSTDGAGRIGEIDPNGNPTSFSFTVPEGVSSIAVGPDGSLYAVGGYASVYRIDPATQQPIYAVKLTPPVSVDNGNIAAIAVDGSGNAYVAGSVLYAAGAAAIPLTLVGYPQPPVNGLQNYIAKLDPTGALISGAAIQTTGPISAIALDPGGSIWGAAASTLGFVVLSLDNSLDSFTHYMTLPAFSGINDANGISGFAVDSSGRALITGTTTARQIPTLTPGEALDQSFSNSNLSAFLLRFLAQPPQADVVVTATSTPATVCEYCDVTLDIQLTNRGSAPALNVLLPFPIPAPVTETVQANITGAGYVIQTGSAVVAGISAVAFPVLQPGETESVQLKTSMSSPTANPSLFPVTAMTSTDNPNQADSRILLSDPLEEVTLIVLNSSGTNIQYQLDTVESTYGTGIPLISGTVSRPVYVTPDADFEIYIPTPQVDGGRLIQFLSWMDNGSTENPRTFHSGSAPFTVFAETREITEPWVSPDYPGVNAANYRQGAVAPGEIISLFGYNLGPLSLQTATLDASGRVATTLAGMQVSFDGNLAPIIFTSSGNLAVVVPYEIAGQQTTQMKITSGSLVSVPVTFSVTDSAPGLFTANGEGIGPLAALNGDGSLNSPSHPAAPGTFVMLYGTGEGLTTPIPADGALAGPSPPQPNLPVSVTVGGQPATVTYAGGAPTLVAGLIQVNVQIPANAPSGLLPVVLTVGTHSSQGGATIAVQ